MFWEHLNTYIIISFHVNYHQQKTVLIHILILPPLTFCVSLSVCVFTAEDLSCCLHAFYVHTSLSSQRGKGMLMTGTQEQAKNKKSLSTVA